MSIANLGWELSNTFAVGQLAQLLDVSPSARPTSVTWRTVDGRLVGALGAFQLSAAGVLTGQVSSVYVGDERGGLIDVQMISVALSDLLGGFNTSVFYNSADTINGTAANDTVVAAGGNDVIWGNNGNDSLIGQTGDDSIEGGAGDDVLSGELGKDTLIGGGGQDFIFGGDDNDLLIGQTGDDSIEGGAGDDVLSGELGKDTLIGGGGNDYIFGGNGNDLMGGGLGNDRMDGGNGNDTVLGGAGADRLSGGEGSDVLIGEAGDDVLLGGMALDTLNGGAGNDWLQGGKGGDTFLFALGFGNTGQDTISDFSRSFGNMDRIVFTGGVTAADLSYVQVAGGVMIQFVAGGAPASVLVQNVTIASLQAGIFFE